MSLISRRSLVQCLGGVGRVLFVAFDLGVVHGVEQVFAVPTGDDEFVGASG